jgi:hypothetical protein
MLKKVLRWAFLVVVFLWLVLFIAAMGWLAFWGP